MKILLVSGHTPGHNKSELTGVNEGDLNVELTKMVKQILDDYADVDAYPYERDMYQDNKKGCLKVNLNDYKYIFEIHFNGVNNKAHGTGIYLDELYKGGISVEQAILKNIVDIGFANRGITRRNDLLNMRTCYNLGIDYALLETCFYDNVDDMKLYQANKEKVANAIVTGIVDAFGLVKKTPAPKEEVKDEIIYTVQVGAYKVKANAEAMLKKIKDAGFSAYITTKNEKAVAEPVNKEVEIGSTVKVKMGAKTFTGETLASFVYERKHQVKEINVDRVVITYNGVVTAAIKKSDLIVVD